ncbi:MAG: lipid-A-disaccharide synthase [Nitrospirae bacterium]|nr:lipid-A-disaccharide synthase [Nitrospirota bacterium]
MIVAGETSGELYGALLAMSLKKRMPDIRIIGVGGERMQQAGVEIISRISSAFGLAEAVSSLKTIRKTFAHAVNALQIYKPDVLVLIDYPDFNLKLAAEARKNHIKVLYYVSPQVWAWRKKRVAKIARLVDRMAVVLPFEEELYKKVGLPCEFVGHPVYDEIKNLPTEKNALKAELGLEKGRPLLSLLPGSRPHELERLLPLMLDVVREYKKEHANYQFCMPFAPNTDMEKYSPILRLFKEEGVIVTKGESLRTLAASEIAVIASGTATLQAALLGVPLVVVYKLFPLTYWIGRMIVKVKHVSLVNILSGRGVVKELLQSEATTLNIVHELGKILSGGSYTKRMMDAYARIREIYSSQNASERVADMAEEMAGWKKKIS